jgi:ketosteroid isomerase-like protein
MGSIKVSGMFTIGPPLSHQTERMEEPFHGKYGSHFVVQKYIQIQLGEESMRIAGADIGRSAKLRRTMAMMFIVGLAASAAEGEARAAPASATSSDLAILTRLSEDWDKAIVRKDKSAIAANMTEDFRQIGSSGDVSDKRTFVEDLTSPDITIDPYTVEDFNIRIYGDVALLNGRTHMTGHQEGKAFKTQYIYIDIYRRVAGQWKVCSVQTTRLPA